MLPSDWGEPHPGPRRFLLPQQRHEVQSRYASVGSSAQLDAVFDGAVEAGADAVFIDSPYIDLDFRSDLAHFYGRAFRPPPDTAERLLFSRGTDQIIGAVVVRPLPQRVGRTVMTPPPSVAAYVSCTAPHVAHAFGHGWKVDGFPFTSQDGEYGVCAHAAMWSVARYHHLRFGTDRYSTAGIIEAAGLRERPDRTARSDGLYALDILRGFRGIGLPALMYQVGGIPSPETLDTVMCRYLNSGIPVGVLTNNHMMVAVGYGERADGSIFYIVSDDNQHAYTRVDQVPSGGANGSWELLVVPMPGRIHVSGEAAEARAEQAFEDRVRATTGPSHLFADWKRLRVRTFATPSASYVARLASRGVPSEIREHHVYAPKSGWLWVSEFQDMSRDTDQRVIGEIVIDATSLQLDPSPIFGNVDGWTYIWESNNEEPLIHQAVLSGVGYASALGDRSEPPSVSS